MKRNHVITAVVAVVLIAIGVVGGFKIHDTFFTLPGSYQGTIDQLKEPSKSESISDARNTAVVRAAKKVSPAVVGITTKVYNRDFFNRKVLVGEGVGSGIIFHIIADLRFTCLCQAVSYTVKTLSAVFTFAVLAFSTCYNATHYK